MIRKFKLSVAIFFIIALIMALAFFATGFLTYLSLRSAPDQYSQPAVWLPMLGLAATTVVVSIFLTFIISRTFFIPIERLIAALKKVASGDFDVRLPEQSETPEVTEMNVNFNKMVSELNSMELLQSDFIQNVSHEITPPLGHRGLRCPVEFRAA